MLIHTVYPLLRYHRYMYDGIDEYLRKQYRKPRNAQPQLTTRKQAMDLLEAVYEKMRQNRKGGDLRSQENWRNVPQIEISDINTSAEKLLEKAVGLLAKHGHMPGFANQVPTASGLSGSSAFKHSNVDLIHWDETRERLRIIELKWARKKPSTREFEQAIFEIIRYALSYIYFRTTHYEKPILRARIVSLEIIAPQCFFEIYSLHKTAIRALDEAIAEFAERVLPNTPTISLTAYRFAEEFQLPFTTGARVKALCNRPTLTPEGRKVREAFANLTKV